MERSPRIESDATPALRLDAMRTVHHHSPGSTTQSTQAIVHIAAHGMIRSRHRLFSRTARRAGGKHLAHLASLSLLALCGSMPATMSAFDVALCAPEALQSPELSRNDRGAFKPCAPDASSVRLYYINAIGHSVEGPPQLCRLGRQDWRVGDVGQLWQRRG